jgi:hypothetical protein
MKRCTSFVVTDGPRDGDKRGSMERVGIIWTFSTWLSHVRNMDEHGNENRSGNAGVEGHVYPMIIAFLNNCLSMSDITGILHGHDKSKALSKLIYSLH